jgi:hypothetical protein
LRYATALDFRRALETRLVARSRETRVPLDWLRKQVAFDRLLARLLLNAPGKWMLKGALALDYRLRDRARTSKDMDLTHQGDEAEATERLLKATELDLGDFFTFQVARTSRLEELAGGTAMRYQLTCRLGRSVFDEATVDVAFAERFPVLEVLETPPLLGFAGIGPLRVPTLPLAIQVAEKVHAYTRQYGASGRPSSRTKDLADLVIVATSFPIVGADLRRGLESTFSSRQTHPMPSALPEPPREWRTDYPRVARRFGIEPDVEAAHRQAAKFIDPVLGAPSHGGRWDPTKLEWVH